MSWIYIFFCSSLYTFSSRRVAGLCYPNVLRSVVGQLWTKFLDLLEQFSAFLPQNVIDVGQFSCPLDLRSLKEWSEFALRKHLFRIRWVLLLEE